MQNNDKKLIEIIFSYCKKIENCQILLKEETESVKEMKYDLVSFYILQIGETVKNLTEEFQNKHKEVEWHKIKGMRNIVVHNYGAINTVRVELTVEKKIPLLKAFCLRFLNKDEK